MSDRSVSPLIIRPNAEQRLWIETRAKENARSLSAEILDAIRHAMKRDPLQIFVRECYAPDGKFYAVAVSLDGDFFETEDRAQAFAVARDKAVELGLSRSAIRFEVEDFTDAA